MIIKSNGRNDGTILEGDALNVALLVPEIQRGMRSGLVGALNDHYGSPRRVADYWHRFESAVRWDGEDPSIFATELETLALKAFRDVGPSARIIGTVI